jgi:hypothetical protein
LQTAEWIISEDGLWRVEVFVAQCSRREKCREERRVKEVLCRKWVDGAEAIKSQVMRQT